MEKQYEGSWLDFISNTEYPFKFLDNFPTDIILDITVGYDSLLFMSKFSSSPRGTTIIFSDAETLSEIAEVVFPSLPGDYILHSCKEEANPMGFIRIGVGINKYNSLYLTKVFTKDESPLLSSSFYAEPRLESINGKGDSTVTVEAGYNMRIQAVELDEDNLVGKLTEIKLTPSLGSGAGVYCGEEPVGDGVFSINSVLPDTNGKLGFTHNHFFLIDDDGTKLIFSLVIPESRLTCTRQGQKGPKGWPGASGPQGPDGQDAVDVNIEYGYCDNPYKGKV